MQEFKENYLNQNERMNPQLENMLKSNTTDLADNPAFPKTDANGNPINFLELIAYKRFLEVVERVKRYTNLTNVTGQAGMSRLTPMLMQGVNFIEQVEQPHKLALENLAVDLVVEEMEIPDGVFQFQCKIVNRGEINQDGFQKETKQPSEEEINQTLSNEAEAENMTPSEFFEMEKHKRRFINMLIQGSSKKGHYMFELVRNKLNEYNPNLAKSYGEVMSINDLIYWLLDDETINQMASQPSAMAGKEEIEQSEDGTIIKTEAICFPVSLHEIIKGIMETFGTQGLPDDPQQANMIIDAVDSLSNETMDLRLGAIIWEKFINAYPRMVFDEGNRYLQHYLFSRFCGLETTEFFRVARMIMANDPKGAKYMERMTDEIISDLNVDEFEKNKGDNEDDINIDDLFNYKKGGQTKNKKGDIGKSGTQYGYTLKEWDKIAEKNGLLVSPTQWWKSQEGKKYKDFVGRNKIVGQHSGDKAQEMNRYGYMIANGMDLGSDKIPASAKKYVQENNLNKFGEGGGVGTKFYVMDAKDGKILSKGFDTEEEAKVEKFKIFEKTNNFFLTQKEMTNDGGGSYIDLFEDYENIPANVQEILDEYDLEEDSDYDTLLELQNRLETIGYTFEYGLDSVPYGLRPSSVKLNELEGYENEEYAEGGGVQEIRTLWRVKGDDVEMVKKGTAQSINRFFNKEQKKHWRGEKSILDDGAGVESWYEDTTKEEVLRHKRGRKSTDQEYAVGGGVPSDKKLLAYLKSKQTIEAKKISDKYKKASEQQGYYGTKPAIHTHKIEHIIFDGEQYSALVTQTYSYPNFSQIYGVMPTIFRLTLFKGSTLTINADRIETLIFTEEKWKEVSKKLDSLKYANGGEIEEYAEGGSVTYDIVWQDEYGEEYSEGFDTIEEVNELINNIKKNGGRIIVKAKFIDNNFKGYFAEGGEAGDKTNEYWERRENLEMFLNLNDEDIYWKWVNGELTDLMAVELIKEIHGVDFDATKKYAEGGETYSLSEFPIYAEYSGEVRYIRNPKRDKGRGENKEYAVSLMRNGKIEDYEYFHFDTEKNANKWVNKLNKFQEENMTPENKKLVFDWFAENDDRISELIGDELRELNLQDFRWLVKKQQKNNFAEGGEAEFDIYDYDKKMALINLGQVYEYAIKLDKIIKEDTDLEEWVKMKLTRIEQNISDVKHSLEGWEKYENGGEIPKKQLLHIAKYSKDLIEMISNGSKLMSWQEDKLAISSASIDDIYHHLDYEMGNRAEDLDVDNEYGRGGRPKAKVLNIRARGGYKLDDFNPMLNYYDYVVSYVKVEKLKLNQIVGKKYVEDTFEFKTEGDRDYWFDVLNKEQEEFFTIKNKKKYINFIFENFIQFYEKAEEEGITKKSEKLDFFSDELDTQLRYTNREDFISDLDLTTKFAEGGKAGDDDVFDARKLDLDSQISSRVYYKGVDNEINKILQNNYKPVYDFDKKGIEWVYKNTLYEIQDEDLILELKEALAMRNRSVVDMIRINNELPRIESKYGKDVNFAKKMYQEAKDFYQNKLRNEKSNKANDVLIDYLISRLKENNKEFAEGGKAQEYGRGGFMSKGELVWKKLSSAEKMNFLSENFTPQITPRSQEILVGKAYNFLPKNVKIVLQSKYANVEDYAYGGEIQEWMEKALQSLIEETGNNNLQIFYVKENEFTCQDDDSEEYRVFKNEDLAYDYAVEEVESDMEYQPENFNRDFIMEYVEIDDLFVNSFENINYDYTKDIQSEKSEKYENRLIEELVANGLISEEEAQTRSSKELDEEYTQDYIDLLTSEQIGDDNGITHFIDNFGENDFFTLVYENNLIDVEDASKKAVEIDGIAHFLAGYDGETIYLDNNIVAYRTN